MKKDIFKHTLHYVVLVIILSLGFLGLTYYRYNTVYQVAISVGLGVAYISWGIVHHMIHKDLHIETVLEYIAVSILGLVIVFSLLFRL